jgi:protein-S-isoprenylcysteine O-methyltransferase Ste14
MALEHLEIWISVFRAQLVLLPAGAWVVLQLRNQQSSFAYAGAFLAFVWMFQFQLLFNALLVHVGIWTFGVEAASLHGVPSAPMLGTSILFGAVLPLVLTRVTLFVRVAFATFGMFTVYVLWITMLDGVGQFASLCFVVAGTVVPGLQLAEWTKKQKNLGWRSLLQCLSWAAVLLWTFPSALFEQSGHSWQTLIGRGAMTSVLWILPMAIPGAMIFSAVRQFAVEGGGTAFPYDPPKRLVTGGVYAYTSNPMQIAVCMMMAWWGIVNGSWLLVLSAVIAFVLFVVFKDICNGSCAVGKTDPNWTDYQRNVPKWIPRLKPWRLSDLTR